MSDIEKQCNDAVVKVDPTMGLVCLILNCIPFTSGVGTMVTACIDGELKTTTLLYGLCQFLLAFLIIGYIWSIFFGVLIYNKSR